MIKRSIAPLAFFLAAATLAGCSHAPVAPATSQAAAAPAANSPNGILALNKRLVANHRSLFSLVKNRYTYYVGGLLLAQYGVDTGILHIASLQSGQAQLDCEYTPQGELFMASATPAAQKAHIADCERLAQSLSADLAR